MELPAAGEHVFAVEGIEKKRIRKVTEKQFLQKKKPQNAPAVEKYWRLTWVWHEHNFSSLSQGKVEYLVKWRGWSPK